MLHPLISPGFLRRIAVLAIVFLSAIPAFAAPPDLTQPGVIAGIDRSSTYNLGATGLRGWIWVDRNNVGDIGLITDQCRQILVTHAVAPASSVLAVDDVILGAIAASSGTVPNFSTDCRKAFGTAIGDAEKTGAGTLRVKRWRAGVISEQNITLAILGNYSATAPFSCPKSALILDNVRNKMVADLIADPNYLTNGFGGASNAIALLSGVKPGDPNYATVQTRLQTYARALAAAGAQNNGLPIWDWSYNLIFLAEYYLLTADAQVVSGIQNFTLTLAEAQSIYGTYGHGPSAFRTGWQRQARLHRLRPRQCSRRHGDDRTRLGKKGPPRRRSGDCPGNRCRHRPQRRVLRLLCQQRLRPIRRT